MLIDPILDEIVNGKRGMLEGIQACMDSKCLVSAVSLMFSTIDALAALTRPPGNQSTDSTFSKAWATEYLKPQANLNCTSDDLWGARCGVLHLYSPESDLSFNGRAKRIYYQWAAGPATETARSIPTGSIVIKVEQDEDLRTKVNEHLPSLLCYVPF